MGLPISSTSTVPNMRDFQVVAGMLKPRKLTEMQNHLIVAWHETDLGTGQRLK
jgi:hypothetical protein